RVAAFVVRYRDVDVQVGRRQQGRGLLGPFGDLQARAREDVAEARVLPLARIVEAVEVEVPGRQRGQLVGLHHRVRRRLDAALRAQRAQQVAHQRGLAGPEIAVQRDECVGDGGVARQALGEGARVVLACPTQGGGPASYNGGVVFDGG